MKTFESIQLFDFREQALVPNRGQELVPFAVNDMNMHLLPYVPNYILLQIYSTTLKITNNVGAKKASR